MDNNGIYFLDNLFEHNVSPLFCALLSLFLYHHNKRINNQVFFKKNFFYCCVDEEDLTYF